MVCDLGAVQLKPRCHELIEVLPRDPCSKPQQNPCVFPETRKRPRQFFYSLKQTATHPLDLVYEKCQKHQKAQNRRKVFFTMSVIVFKIVSKIFQSVEGFMVSRPEELPLWPLAERCGSLSTHTAPIRQTLPSFRYANVQTVSAAASLSFAKIMRPLFCVVENAYISSLPRLSVFY